MLSSLSKKALIFCILCNITVGLSSINYVQEPPRSQFQIVSLPGEIGPTAITEPTTTTSTVPVEISTSYEPISTTTTTEPAPPTSQITTTTLPTVVEKNEEISDDIWWQLALCEDGGNNRMFGPYSGYFHFLPSTWWGIGGPSGYPHEYSYEVQKRWAQVLQAQAGWGQWPGCKYKLGL